MATAKDDVVAPEVLAAIDAAKNAPALITGNQKLLEELQKAQSEQGAE
jgi:hypothetical protein